MSSCVEPASERCAPRPSPLSTICRRRCASSRSGGRPKSPASPRSPASAGLTLALLTWSVSDPSLNHATSARIHNLLGAPGAIAADLVMQFIGLASAALLVPPAFWGWSLLTQRRLERPRLKAGLYLARRDRGGGAGVPASRARKLAAADRSRRRRRRRGTHDPAPHSSGLAMGDDRARRRSSPPSPSSGSPPPRAPAARRAA